MPVPAGAQGSGRTVLLTLTEGASLTQLADTVGALGGRVLATLDLSDSLLVELPTGVGAPAGSAEIPDTPMKVNGTRTVDEPAEAPTYRATIGATDPNAGEGVTVALVDTGVADVPDLDDVVHLPIKGVGKGDGLGHGTFLAGIISGEGPNLGVAPGATLLDVKVAADDGSTSLSKVLQGLEIASQKKADVVNLSLSTENPLPPAFDPLSLALDRLWSRGVTVITAAGNDGPADDSVGSPGNDPLLITVGALDEGGDAERSADTVAPFSSRGTAFYEGKPDLVAPGVSIISTAAPDSSAYTKNPASHVGESYMRGTGTSMAAAVVSGAAAAVLSANSNLKPNGVKALLTKTAYPLADNDGAGAGALDLGAAVAAAAGTTDVNPDQVLPDGDAGDWGPSEDDAELWAAFAAAWEAGNFDDAKAAWEALSWQTQQWASRGWMLAVLAGSLGKDEAEFSGRSWAARSWAFDAWLARSWAGRSWAARSWAARSWAADDWLARSWAARSWAARSWAARSWAARSWAARSWADEEWAARSWAARSWATDSWDTSSWSMAS
jgi:serine protease AprX